MTNTLQNITAFRAHNKGMLKQRIGRWSLVDVAAETTANEALKYVHEIQMNNYGVASYRTARRCFSRKCRYLISPGHFKHETKVIAEL